LCHPPHNDVDVFIAKCNSFKNTGTRDFRIHIVDGSKSFLDDMERTGALIIWLLPVTVEEATAKVNAAVNEGVFERSIDRDNKCGLRLSTKQDVTHRQILESFPFMGRICSAVMLAGGESTARGATQYSLLGDGNFRQHAVDFTHDAKLRLGLTLCNSVRGYKKMIFEEVNKAKKFNGRRAAIWVPHGALVMLDHVGSGMSTISPQKHWKVGNAMDEPCSLPRVKWRDIHYPMRDEIVVHEVQDAAGTTVVFDQISIDKATASTQPDEDTRAREDAELWARAQVQQNQN